MRGWRGPFTIADMSVSDWGGPGDADSPAGEQDAGTEAQGAADKRLRELNFRVGLEATRIAETRRGRQYVRHGLALRDFATTGTSPNLATDELHFAKQVIDSLTASIDAGGPGGAPAHAYPADAASWRSERFRLSTCRAC